MSEDKELDRQMSQSINPRVREVDVGTRTLRKIKIYPLSLSDQGKLSDLVTEAIQIYVKESGDGGFTPELVSKLIDLIRIKLPDMLKLLLDPKEKPQKLLSDMDNYQLATIVEIVFNDNYGEPVKKLASLFRPQTQGNESALERLSHLSAGTTPATGLNTSPDSATKKVE